MEEEHCERRLLGLLTFSGFNGHSSLFLVTELFLSQTEIFLSLMAFRKFLSVRKRLAERYSSQFHLFKSVEIGQLLLVRVLVGMLNIV